MATQIITFDVGLRHFAYCIMRVEEDGARTIQELDLIDLGCKKRHVQRIIDACIELLDDIAYRKIDMNLKTVVLIENQMTAIMRCVQTVINTYFKITAKYTSLDADTQVVSAKHKLNLIHKYSDYTPPDGKDPSTKYKKNKQSSIDFALWLLQNEEQNMAVFEKVTSMKKKDDVTDAYLMALYHATCCMGLNGVSPQAPAVEEASGSQECA